MSENYLIYRLYSAARFAKLIGVSRQTLYLWDRNGKLKATPPMKKKICFSSQKMGRRYGFYHFFNCDVHKKMKKKGLSIPEKAGKWFLNSNFPCIEPPTP